MKRRDLISKLEEMGCIFVRHGGKHDWYQNPITKISQAVPRHREIKEQLAKHIIKMLSTVLPQIRKNLKQLYGKQLDKLILFGSQARGTAQPDSDIDILIVLKDVFNYSQESEKISQIIADLCLEYNVLISCAFATSEQLENYDSGFFRNVRQDGLLI
jgi:uncharacterized protein